MNSASSTIIRHERLKDIKEIYKVNLAAFGRETEARLVDLLRARGKAVISLVAERQGVILGHILFSPVSITPEQPGFNALGLAPMAVLPEYQRQGIGSSLVTSGLDTCREYGYNLAVVLGHTDFYPRFGFAPASHYQLDNEYQVDEPFMAIEFVPGALMKYRGMVKYGPEFSEIGA